MTVINTQCQSLDTGTCVLLALEISRQYKRTQARGLLTAVPGVTTLSDCFHPKVQSQRGPWKQPSTPCASVGFVRFEDLRLQLFSRGHQCLSGLLDFFCELLLIRQGEFVLAGEDLVPEITERVVGHCVVLFRA